jgi:hypothetical protein
LLFVPQATSAVDLARIRRNFFAPASDRYPDFGKLCQKKAFVVLIGASGCGRPLPEKQNVCCWGSKIGR